MRLRYVNSISTVPAWLCVVKAHKKTNIGAQMDFSAANAQLTQGGQLRRCRLAMVCGQDEAAGEGVGRVIGSDGIELDT